MHGDRHVSTTMASKWHIIEMMLASVGRSLLVADQNGLHVQL